MAGGTSVPAREVFAHSLSEALFGTELEAVKPLKRLDDGVAGTSSANAGQPSTGRQPEYAARRKIAVGGIDTNWIWARKFSLSFAGISRTVSTTGCCTPIPGISQESAGTKTSSRDRTIDAAHVGVALDFAFPLPAEQNAEMLTEKRRDVGHNLYDRVYAHQFTRLSDCLAGGAEAERSFSTLPVYGDRRGKVAYQPPHSRAYLHHLLHTHEMSAHTLLVTHNLAVLDIFLSGVRKVLAAENTNGQGDGEGNVGGTTRFAVEVNRFESMYNEGSELIAAAREDWRDVKFARGKGRLAREKQKRAFESTAEHIGG
ncbi:hypothetical protein ID866_4098 [Astraeus odoratus]|nr:hypothetical protein ID866_4098 [Astraeus odoratus]